MTAGHGRRKLAPTTLYGLVAKNYTEQFTAWTSKGAKNPAGSLPVTKVSCRTSFGPITEDDKWGEKKWVAYAFFSVVKGCCPGEDVRSHYVRVYVSRSAFASYLIATINVKCLVGTRNPRAMSPTLQMLAARH